MRERGNVGEGSGRPRFEVVGVQGGDLTFILPHLRKVELETIAKVVGAEVVMLPGGSGRPGT